MRLPGKLGAFVALAGVCALSLGAGYVVSLLLPHDAVPAAHAQDVDVMDKRQAWDVEARRATVQGREVGEVLINRRVVIRFRAEAGRLRPYDRAREVAQRLDYVLHETDFDRFYVADVRGATTIRTRTHVIVTVNTADARAQNASVSGLARQWATNLNNAVGYRGPVEPGTDWRPAESYDDKWVPIVSVLRGVRVGVARVNGPTSRVRQVQAVAQLETRFRDIVEINIYIPISTEVPGRVLDRVQGCAVTGLGDIRL